MPSLSATRSISARVGGFESLLRFAASAGVSIGFGCAPRFFGSDSDQMSTRSSYSINASR